MDDTEASVDSSEPAQARGSEGHRHRDQPCETPASDDEAGHGGTAEVSSEQPREIGGRKGPDPVRYGDWEKNGRCIDF